MDAQDALAKAPIFSHLNPGALGAISRAAKLRQLAPGELVVREGEDATGFFLLCQGQAEVVKGLGRDGERTLGTLGEGDFFGEMALFDGFRRSATVRAVSDCECLVLERSDFLPLVATRPEVALALLQVLSRRLREVEDQLLL